MSAGGSDPSGERDGRIAGEGPLHDDAADSAPLQGRRRRGVYLLPNLFTTGVLFSGFFAIVSAIDGEYITAAIAIFVAMVLDTLDGRVARMTDTQSEFGAQYDSLSDLVSFGVAPALIVYLWQLHDLGNFGWVAAFFFATAAALRLARFNSRLAVSDKRFFQGLPSPASAALLVGMVWVLEDWGVPAELADPYVIGILIVTVLAGAAMVSNLTYFSFKDMDFKHRVPFFAIVGVVVALMLLALDPPKVLLAGFVIYALSGPLLTLERWRRHRRRAPAEE